MTTITFDPRPAVIAELAKLGLAAEPLHVNKIKIVGDSEDTTTDHFVEIRTVGMWRGVKPSVVIGNRSKIVRYILKPGNDFNAAGAAARLVQMHAKKLEARVDMGIRHAHRDLAEATLKRTVGLIGGEAPDNLHAMRLDASSVYTDRVSVKLWADYTPEQVVRLHALLATFKQEDAK